MKIVVPANPIKIYQRNGDTPEDGYLTSNIAFIIVDGPPDFPKLTYVTISGTPIPNRDISFARVLIDGAWVSHE
jgi:hypothetical protein